MAHDREVAGIRCTEVLDARPDYVSGVLPKERTEQVEAHLRGCDWCERFGGAYASTVETLRSRLTEPPPLDPDVRARLDRRLSDS